MARDSENVVGEDDRGTAELSTRPCAGEDQVISPKVRTTLDVQVPMTAIAAFCITETRLRGQTLWRKSVSMRSRNWAEIQTGTPRTGYRR